MVATTMRPITHLQAAGKKYPAAWKIIERFRADRGQDDFIDWPDWCYCPMAASYAVVSGGGDGRANLGNLRDVSILSAMSAWRVTQTVYRFDADLYASLIATPVEKLPVELLYRLPQWCVYIETPGITPADDAAAGYEQYGFFAHLEYDANTGNPELRLLLDVDHRHQPLLIPVVLHLTHTTISDAIQSALLSARQASGVNIPLPAATKLAADAAPLVSLLLYLCSAQPDYGDKAPPQNPQPKKTKKGLRLFPPSRPTVMDVGVRIGAALRAGQNSTAASSATGQGGSKRPHVRRAHWHLYWTGPGRSVPKLNWIPPVGVNLDGIPTTTTITPVRR